MSISSAERARPLYSSDNKSLITRSWSKTKLRETPQDISAFYSVENELKFLDKWGGNMTQKEQLFYLVENQMKFLGEFVGKLKFTKINYLLNHRNGFNFAGLRMIDMLKDTSSLAGQFSREGYENTGLVTLFEIFEDSLSNHEINIPNGLILSPPKDWDYAFAFYYVKKIDPYLNEYVVTMYPLGYEEKGNQLNQSKRLLKSLPGEHADYSKEQDFLTQPLTENVPDLNQMMALTDISTQDVKLGEKFEAMMQIYLGAEIALYTKTLISLHERRDSMSAEEVTREFSLLEKIRRFIFNKSVELWAQKDMSDRLSLNINLTQNQGIVEKYTRAHVQPMVDMRMIHQYSEYAATSVTGGGSCPIAKKSTSNSSLAQEIMKGNSIENLITKNDILGSENSNPGSDEFGSLEFDCPDCHKTNQRPPHTLLPTCLHCGSDKVCAPKK